MDKFRAMKLFVRLADLGSFTEVADELNTSKSMVSKEITRLEKSLGARLLHRSTRKLQLTDVGEGYLQRCRQILLEVDDSESYIQERQSRPMGRLRVNAPMALGMTDLAAAFSVFLKQYPDIKLDIELGDEWVDLIEHDFDLGFRVASASFDSNYVGRVITHFQYKVCASERYLQANSQIKKAGDLKDHNCFSYAYLRGRNEWPLGDGVQVSGNLRANNTSFIKQLIIDGHGIGLVPDFICKDELEDGRLIEILPDVKRPILTLHAIFPARQFVPPKITACVSFMQEWFATGR